MLTLMHWIGPTFDLLAIVLLAAVLWRLGRAPALAWQERETRLQAIFDELRTLVAQSEGLARDLDAKLAGREERLQALLEARPGASERQRIDRHDAEPVAPRQAAAPDVAARHIETLAASGVAIDDIARQVGVAPAEVRLVIGLKAARAARRRAQAGEAGADAR
jgi:hypothetical protein